MSGTRSLTSVVGRPRFGGGPLILLSVSAVAGLILGATLGALAAMFRPTDPTGTIILIFTIVCSPVGAALAWALLVDRCAPSDAPARPEDSIERHWADAAARGAFLDLLIFCGLGSAVLAVTGVEFQAHSALAFAIALGGVDFWLRYSRQRRANS